MSHRNGPACQFCTEGRVTLRTERVSWCSRCGTITVRSDPPKDCPAPHHTTRPSLAVSGEWGKRSPIPMILYCPLCSVRHIDEGAFATKPHHTHACQGCGFVWRPAIVATVGVQFLPGFKNEAHESPPAEGEVE